MKLLAKGKRLIKVTDGAYEEIFKNQGWNIVEDKKEEPEQVEEKKEKTELELLVEKPLGKWNAKEVKLFADEYDIDIKDTKNVTEAKEIIKEYL